jgi:hypothetical protein
MIGWQLLLGGLVLTGVAVAIYLLDRLGLAVLPPEEAH